MRVLFTTVVVVLLTAFSSATMAQLSVNKGIKGGLNLAKISVDNSEDVEFSSKNGIVAGAFIELDLLGPIDFQTELLFSQKGVKAATTGGDLNIESTFSIGYIEAPVLVKVGFPLAPLVSFQVYGGPAFALKVSESVDTPFLGGSIDEDAESGDSFVGSDIGASFGGALNISAIAAGLVLDVRYTLGLSNLVDYSALDAEDGDINIEAKSRVLTLSVGVKF